MAYIPFPSPWPKLLVPLLVLILVVLVVNAALGAVYYDDDDDNKRHGGRLLVWGGVAVPLIIALVAAVYSWWLGIPRKTEGLRLVEGLQPIKTSFHTNWTMARQRRFTHERYQRGNEKLAEGLKWSRFIPDTPIYWGAFSVSALSSVVGWVLLGL